MSPHYIPLLNFHQFVSHDIVSRAYGSLVGYVGHAFMRKWCQLDNIASNLEREALSNGIVRS